VLVVSAISIGVAAVAACVESPQSRGFVTDDGSATIDGSAAAAGSSAGRIGGASPRIVTLLPAASAVLVALGAEGSIVGRAADDRTPALAHRAVVGTVLRADPERVRALEPDLVLVAPSTPHEHLAAVLGPTAEIRPVGLERLNDVAAQSRALGRVVGREVEGARLAERLEVGFDSVRRRTPACPRSALWAVGLVPPVVAGPGTLPDDLLGVVGARNALADARVPWPRPALEVLVDRAVDVIVWPVGGDLPPFADVPRSSPWKRLPAARVGSVVELESELVHEAGPRLAEAATRLAIALDATCPSAATGPAARKPLPLDHLPLHHPMPRLP
jgi:vitamin B12 transport system substrate-binding protein